MTDEPIADDGNEIATRVINATCENDECANAGIAIALTVAAELPNPAVVCGACGNPITNIT